MFMIPALMAAALTYFDRLSIGQGFAVGIVVGISYAIGKNNS